MKGIRKFAEFVGYTLYHGESNLVKCQEENKKDFLEKG